MIKILSIDGGGIRGLVPAAILAEIERRTGRPICELFDYIAGTSTGGIIASMLAIPNPQGRPKYTAEQIKSCYIDLGKCVFHNSLPRTIFTLGGLLFPRYSTKKLEKLMKDYLGNVRLHAALTNVLIAAYETVSNSPWFFKSRFAAGHRTDEDDPLLVQVARATSAAPVFFSPCKIGRRCFIDGGIFANNPALCAYAEAKKQHPQENDFLILSLGTGRHQESLTYQKINHAGALRWAIPILDLLSNAASGTVDYQMHTLVGKGQYTRFEFLLDDRTNKMDDASKGNIERLEKIARTEIQQNAEKISRICRILT